MAMLSSSKCGMHSLGVGLDLIPQGDERGSGRFSNYSGEIWIFKNVVFVIDVLEVMVHVGSYGKRKAGEVII